ncbi:hydrogenase maturation protease [Chloroflexota bacterium]
MGVGNILLSDEGVGVHVVREMEGHNIPEDVELFDGGTASVDLLNVLANRRKVIIVDAVKTDSEPGTLYRFTPNDIKVEQQIHSSLHQIGLLETLQMTKHLNCEPDEVVILGIEPKNLSWGMKLSPEVAEVVPRVIELVLEEIQ